MIYSCRYMTPKMHTNRKLHYKNIVNWQYTCGNWLIYLLSVQSDQHMLQNTQNMEPDRQPLKAHHDGVGSLTWTSIFLSVWISLNVTRMLKGVKFRTYMYGKDIVLVFCSFVTEEST